MISPISKSQFKPKALEYLRMVEQLKQQLIITHEGKPVVRVIPYVDDVALESVSLQGTVISYSDPFESVGESDWEATQ